ncbi:MAG: 1,4-alpha-glucan branching protein GlgB [Clostridiales bacterium]|nr:1,4-alpha-glucan branching protein GlgB [Clostridiales bacterium]
MPYSKKNAFLFESDVKKFISGEHYESYKFMGSKLLNYKGKDGASFCVFAPNAKEVRVVGNFNGWNGRSHRMYKVLNTGLWWLFIEGINDGEIYKYEIHKRDGSIVLKSDPYAIYSELRPNTASIVTELKENRWNDEKWLNKRENSNIYESPVNIYEVHLGSWMRGEGNRLLSYREIADKLCDYVLDMGYTHVEIMPVSEYPLDESWGYQPTGYFSVTSRYGRPEDFKYLIDKLHQNGIGVILDWVPGHFCRDEHGLYCFDGGHVFESDNPLLADNWDWGTANFDYGKAAVQSFLISNALYWFEEFHVDGLRVDAVAAMLYLDYGKQNMNIRNKFGGRENLEAVEFLRKLNKAIFERVKNPLMIAEESTAWPLVTYPVHDGGLGFNYKWNMGWMNDMLRYMQTDFPYRKDNHNLVTFSIMYAFSENFVLPLSHDEVVHGKKSLIDKMPGTYEEKFANLRAFYGYMMTHPGKKLLFMGGEFGQFIEWRFYEGLEWFMLKYPMHDALKRYVKDLNELYKDNSELYELDHKMEGFEWIDASNAHQSVFSFIRRNKDGDYVVVICNFNKGKYEDFKIGVPELCEYEEIFNSDRDIYGGSNFINNDVIMAKNQEWHGRKYHINVKVAPLSFCVLKPIKEA